MTADVYRHHVEPTITAGKAAMDAVFGNEPKSLGVNLGVNGLPTALDVVAQRSLMVQIKELQERLGFAVIFVTHDMSLVSHFSDRLLVMYAAQVAEFGKPRQIFETPRHPYTRALLDAFPSIHGPNVRLTGIPGAPPDLARPPEGCRFAPRCPHATPRFCSAEPPLFDVEGDLVRCFLYENGTVPETAVDTVVAAPEGVA